MVRTSPRAHRHQVYLLGAFRIEREAQSIHLPTRKIESLLAYLILHPRAHTREKLAALFWGSSSNEKAHGSLRKALMFLRQFIADEIVIADRETVQLNPLFSLWVDVNEFEPRARQFLTGPIPDPNHINLDLYQGALLPDLYDDWILPLREHYHALYISAMLRAVENLRSQSKYDDAIQYAQKMLMFDSSNEQAYQHLIFCHAAIGDRSGALHQFETCQRVLERELGVEPAHETKMLYAWITQSDADIQSLAARVTNLPIPISSFVGRARELTEIRLSLSNTRLLTLTGAGGSGKTRLAIRAATDLIDAFYNGVWWVDLSSLMDGALVPQSVANVLSVKESHQQTLIESLINYIHKKELLLVIDNCEHMVGPIARLVTSLLSQCPHLKILATSREVLRIDGEIVFNVPMLLVPNSRDEISIAELLLEYESVKLFVVRAQSIQSNFMLDNQTALFVAQICARLDGLPLAIELAAARVRTMSVEQIAAHLNDIFHLLIGGNRASLPRQQTLRAMIDWSYDLLLPNEQILFRRLSVFVGGWTLEAAESVCGIKPTSSLARSEDILNLIEQLINKSLVITNKSQGASRYHILETLRQYANEKLAESGEYDALRDSHLDYFLDLAETAEPYLRGAEQFKWFKRLDAEIENLRAALEWALSKESPEPALRLGGALGVFWNIRADDLEGARWLDLALRKEWDTESTAEKAARAKALYHRADMASALDEMDILKSSAESALALCEEVGDSWGTAYSRALIATHQLFLRVTQASIPLYEQSLNEFKSLGDAWGESRVSRLLAQALLNAGVQEGYLETMQRALACALASGDRYSIAKSLMSIVGNRINNSQWDEAEKFLQEIERLYAEVNSSKINWAYYYRTQIFFARGNLERAKADAELFIEYCIRVGERNLRAVALFFLAWIAETEHDLPGAVENGEKGLELFRKLENPAYIAFGLVVLGFFKYQQGNTEVARQHTRECLEIVSRGEVGAWVLLYILCYLGGLFVEKKSQTAVQILALSESWAQLFPAPRDALFDKPYYERFLAAARMKLSEAEFSSAWEAGWTLTLDETVELAMKAVEEM